MKFNTTGVCIPRVHYMVDITENLKKIKAMIGNGDYFLINRPRQYGRTTTMYMLKQYLKEEYLILSISFEGIDEESFKDSKKFTNMILRLFSNSIKLTNKEKSLELLKLSQNTSNMIELSNNITEFIRGCDKKVILFIDEVDESSNNDLFLDFLDMLRNKYLLRAQKEDVTFQSVILVGVYEIKDLKLASRVDEVRNNNSPWNSAMEFDIEMSFSVAQIQGMLQEYCSIKNVEMNTLEIGQILHYYTDGYPFLVSRLCKIIDEDLLVDKHSIWNDQTIKKSVKYLLSEVNTLFDDLIKNIENNEELQTYIFEIVINKSEKSFNIDNPVINIGFILGYLKNVNGKVKISNRIFEQRLYNYFSSKLENKTLMSNYN